MRIPSQFAILIGTLVAVPNIQEKAHYQLCYQIALNWGVAH